MAENQEEFIFKINYVSEGIDKAIQDKQKLDNALKYYPKTASGGFRDPNTGRFASSSTAIPANASMQLAAMSEYQQRVKFLGLQQASRPSKPTFAAPPGFETGGTYFNPIQIAQSRLGKRSGKIEDPNDLINQTEKLGKATDGLGARMSKMGLRAAEVIPIWIALRAVYMTVFNSISEGIKFLIEFESAMAQIRIVGEGTEEEYQRLGDAVMTFSTTYGVAASKGLAAAKIFAQQGLKINEVIEMTRTAMIGSVVLGEDVAKVAEDLTSAVRAYNMSMTDSLSIVDKWMTVQKGFAVTARDLAEATKTAGATAASFGVSYDKFLGQITAIIEVTRKSGSEAANALQMMYTRLFSTARIAVQEIAKVPVYQNEAGQAVMETTNIFRASEDVLDDLAKSWATLSEEQRISLAVQVGSRRQATPFIALMNNYNRALEAQVASLTSAGDALASFNIMQDTTAVKMTQMQNTWTQLARTIGDTSLFKFAIDTVKNLAEGIIALANATDYAAMKLREKKQVEIDEISLNLSRAQALKEIEKIETRLNKNPTEGNKKLLEKTKQSKEAILAANPLLSALDVESEEYRKVRREVEIERSKELEILKASEKSLSAADLILPGKTKLEQVQAKQAIIKKYGSIEKARQEIEDSIEKEARSRLAIKGIGAIGSEISEAKIEAVDEKQLQTKKEAEQLAIHESNLLKIKGASEEKVLEYLIKQYETQELLVNAEDKRAKLAQLRYQLEEKNLEQLYEYSNKIESTLSSSIKDMMSGTGNFSDLLSNLNKARIDMFRETVSDSLGKSINSLTGGGLGFGTAMMSLKGKIETAHQTVYRWIVKGHSDGAKIAKGDTTAMIASWKDGSGAMGDLGTLSLLATNPKTIKGGRGGVDTGMQMIGGVMAPTWSPYPDAATATDNQDFRKFAGGIAQSAITGYTAYQSGKAAGLNPGMNAASTGLMTVGTALVPTPLAPIGIALQLIGVAMQMFGGKKSKQESTQTQTIENRLSSKIDVTNKNLEIINRNLIGMRNDIRTYILPQSAYWSTKDSLDDEFSLSARRGQF
jgi:TP901 family phage tail tape measure protein